MQATALQDYTSGGKRHDQSYGFDCIVLFLAISICKHLSSRILTVLISGHCKPSSVSATRTDSLVYQSSSWEEARAQIWMLSSFLPAKCGEAWLWAHCWVSGMEVSSTSNHSLPEADISPASAGNQRAFWQPVMAKLSHLSPTVTGHLHWQDFSAVWRFLALSGGFRSSYSRPTLEVILPLLQRPHL